MHQRVIDSNASTRRVCQYSVDHRLVVGEYVHGQRLVPASQQHTQTLNTVGDFTFWLKTFSEWIRWAKSEVSAQSPKSRPKYI